MIQDAETGLYLIDTTKIPDDAGYELIDTGNTSANQGKFIALPDIKNAAKPMNGDFKKSE